MNCLLTQQSNVRIAVQMLVLQSIRTILAEAVAQVGV